MPDRVGERDWEAIIRAINPDTSKRDLAAKVAACWLYHKWKLHGIENHMAPESRSRMEKETFSLLNDEEKKVLDEAHYFLRHHNY